MKKYILLLRVSKVRYVNFRKYQELINTYINNIGLCSPFSGSIIIRRQSEEES